MKEDESSPKSKNIKSNIHIDVSKKYEISPISVRFKIDDIEAKSS
jgi:hypothetical protein